MSDHDKLIAELTDKAARSGLLIEMGWLACRKMVLRGGGHSEEQIRAARMFFFAGAQHLFASLTGTLDPGLEPTSDDLVKMQLLDAELTAFADQIMGTATKETKQ